MRDAWRRGAVIAGASAGAMALAEWTWTPARRHAPASGTCQGLAVVPHFDDARRRTWQASVDGIAPGGVGYLGLDERTGVISAGERRRRAAGSSPARVRRTGSRSALGSRSSPATGSG